MVLDVAAGVLIAGIIAGVFSIGAWMFLEGFPDERGLSTTGGILAIVGLAAAIGLIANQTLLR
jgi:hypothetical protein